MHRDFLPTALLDAVKRHPRVHRAARGARRALGRFVPPRRFAGIPGRVHPNDYMFARPSSEEVASYSARALNVIQNIEAALAAADLTYGDVERWLDFGCGYGRVVRYLIEHVPPERVWASDLVEEGVTFCASEFGVRPIPSQADLTQLRLPPFDFIYAISVLTHLNERNSVALLRLLGEALRPGGIGLFTTHGRYSLENAELYVAEYVERQAEISRTVDERGTFFVPYRFTGSDDYGMAWHSREWIEAQIGALHGGQMKQLLFMPRGLDGHQDVLAFQRAAQPADRHSRRGPPAR